MTEIPEVESTEKKKRAKIDMREFARIYRSLPPNDQKEFIQTLSSEEAYIVDNSWEFRAREKQIPPNGDWRYCLFLAGRGWGKTDSIVQWAHQQAMSIPGSVGLMVATIASDVRDVLIEGPSGILMKTPPHERPEYLSTKSLLIWPNGSIARLRSADKPDGLRGLNSWWAVGDEYASWRRPDSLNQILLGLRLGKHPRLVLATTPKPVKHLRKFLERKKLVVISGSSYENRDNLSADWFEDIVASYAGTDIEQQEIDGILLDDKMGALWTSALIEEYRIRNIDAFDFKKLIRIVIAVDPAVSALSGSNFTGIMVVGMDARGHFYILDDLTVKGSPEVWGRRAVQAFHDWNADLIVGEVNNGGDLVQRNIEATEKNLPFKAVHASRGKVLRAEPIVNFYQQGRVHHLGVLAALESQMVEWVTGDISPDRIDAMVWGVWSLAFPDTDDRPVIVRRAIARFNTDLTW